MPEHPTMTVEEAWQNLAALLGKMSTLNSRQRRQLEPLATLITDLTARLNAAEKALEGGVSAETLANSLESLTGALAASQQALEAMINQRAIPHLFVMSVPALAIGATSTWINQPFPLVKVGMTITPMLYVQGLALDILVETKVEKEGEVLVRFKAASLISVARSAQVLLLAHNPKVST